MVYLYEDPRPFNDRMETMRRGREILRQAMLQVLERAAQDVEGFDPELATPAVKAWLYEAAARIRSIDLGSGELKP